MSGCLSFNCCKNVAKENEVNYITNAPKPVHEGLRLQLMQEIKKFNTELGNPKIFINGKIFALTYETLCDPSMDHYLFKNIVVNHYNNNLIKVSEGLEVELENISNIVKVLQGRE